MKRAGSMHRFIAGVLAVALAGYQIPATALAAANPTSSTAIGPAEIRGNVFGADGLTALAGVSVKAAHMTTHKIYSSAATGADGLYRLSDLPPGSYDLAVETSGGLYAADALVEVKPGRRTSVSLAIRPEARQEGQPQEGEKKEGEGAQPADPNAPPQAGEPPAEPEPQKPGKKGGSFWRSPAGAAIAIVAGAALIGVAANSAAGDDEEDTPPLTQSGN